MSAFVKRLRSGAAWIGAAALAANMAAARAQGAASPSESGAATVSAPRDARPSSELRGADFAPTGATKTTHPTSSPKAADASSRTGEVSHLDFAPTSVIAPLPPDAPPPSATAAIAPLESPAAAPDIAGALESALNAYVAQGPTARTPRAIEESAAREAIRAFYASRLYAPVWVDAYGLSAEGRSVLARLARAAEDGLDLSGYALPPPDFAESRPESLAATEATLSAASVAYARQASGSRVVPSTISALVTAHPAVADPGQALSAVASAADPGEALRAYNPPQKGYEELRAQLARLRESAPTATAPPPTGPTLRIGMADPRVPLIRSRFGLGAKPESGDEQIYDARVASAVAAFQKSHGLPANGALTSATNEALFTDPSARREALILANMEMWRWEPRDMGERRVEINVADFMLHVMSGDSEVKRARVIVGKPDTPTPIFSNEIKYIVVNPIWRVPQSIIRKEMEPRLADDPDYLTRRGFKVTWIGGRLVVEQPPGEANALGRILFMFPNEHAVYLHDTPSRALFATPRRAYSHGCIRVEGPARLAELFMGGATRGWTAERVQSMVGTTEKTLFLPRPVPIHIEYFTEFVDESGMLQERDDVYGLTNRVAATLSKFRQG